jgi:hypothetical protein
VMIHPYDLIFTGLDFDIAGTLILAKGLMFKNPTDAFYESRTIMGGNYHVLKSALLQRAEARVGGAFLTFGFGLQIWGNLDGGVAVTDLGWVNSWRRVLAVLIAIGIFAVMSLKFEPWRTRSTFRQQYYEQDTPETLTVPKNDPTWLHRRAVLLDIRRRRHESDAWLLARVQARHATLRAKYRRRA